MPDIAQDIKDIVEPCTHVDPKFKNPLKYTRITAKAVRRALIDSKGYTDDELPTERTISNMMNQLGYTLKRVEKTKPQKKIKERPLRDLKLGISLLARGKLSIGACIQ